MTRFDREGRGIGTNTDMKSFPTGWYALAKSTGPGGAYEMVINGPNGETFRGLNEARIYLISQGFDFNEREELSDNEINGVNSSEESEDTTSDSSNSEDDFANMLEEEREGYSVIENGSIYDLVKQINAVSACNEVPFCRGNNLVLLYLFLFDD